MYWKQSNPASRLVHFRTSRPSPEDRPCDRSGQLLSQACPYLSQVLSQLGTGPVTGLSIAVPGLASHAPTCHRSCDRPVTGQVPSCSEGSQYPRDPGRVHVKHRNHHFTDNVLETQILLPDLLFLDCPSNRPRSARPARRTGPVTGRDSSCHRPVHTCHRSCQTPAHSCDRFGKLTLCIYLGLYIV